MSTTSVITQINTQTLNYLPSVLAGIQAAEAASSAIVAAGGTAPTGQDKLNVVLAGISAGSSALAVSANQTVAQTAELINLISLSVSIFNGLGLFKKSVPAAAPHLSSGPGFAPSAA